MQSLASQMAVYQRYHRSPKNRLTHFVGVPVIMLSVFQALSWIGLGASEFTAAQIGALIVLAYYFLLDVPLALAATMLFAILVAAGQALATRLAPLASGLVCGALFVGGWILQLIGHYAEGRKPALADNLFQIFIAPIFLLAEIFFVFGYKPSLRQEIEARSGQ